MSFFCCPICGHRAELFGAWGRAWKRSAWVPTFLRECRCSWRSRTASDAGTPIVAAAPESAAARAFTELAEQLWRKVSEAAPPGAGPRIVIG